MKMSEEAERVAPRHSDIMFPERVMKVIPTATQPIKDMEVSRAARLGVETKPGVVKAPTVKRRSTARRIQVVAWRLLMAMTLSSFLSEDG
jgi:hypothetical protein